MAFQNAEAIQKLYVAFFNRPADYYGLQYWDSVVTAANGSTAAVAAEFSKSKEYTDTFAGMNTRQVINTVYKNLFGRSADEAGLEYWFGEVTAGRVTIANAVTSIAAGAQNADKIAYASKVTAATAFTDALNTTDERLGYAGEKANAVAKQFLAGVTDAATLATAIAPANLDATINTSVNAGAVTQTFALTKGLDNVTGSNGNDVIVGATDGVAGSELNTLSSIDLIDGGAGVDTLKIAHADGDLTLGTLTNIEVVEINSADNTAQLKVSTVGVAGVTDLNIVKAANAVEATAAATTNVNVSLRDGTGIGAIDVIGGKNVNVALTDADSAINVGAAGAADAVGAVTISATGAAVVNNTDTVTTATKTMGNITVGGGTTVSVTQKATVTNSAQLADGGKEAVVQGNVAITANATTTDVTVKQDATISAQSRAAVAGVTEVATVKFVALKANDTVTVGGLTFKAVKDLSAAQVAEAFANLATTAVKPTQVDGFLAPATGAATGDTNGSSVAANGTFSGSLLANWSTGAAAGDTVTFTGKANTAMTNLTASTVAATAVAPTVTTTTDGVTAVSAQNRLGVTAGTVSIVGDAALKNVTVDGYAASTGAAGISNKGDLTTNLNAALATVTLANGAGFDIDSAAATLALNLTNVDGTVNVAAGTKTLNASVTGDSVVSTLASATADAINVAGTGNVKGTTAAGGLTAAAAINTSAMTAGTAEFVIANGTATSYTGGAAADDVTISNANVKVTKAVDLGAGDDMLTLEALTGDVAVPTAALNGGAGTDIIGLTGASAQALSANGDFAGKIEGFEKLEITNTVSAATTVNMSNMDGIKYVVSNNSTAAGAASTKEVFTVDFATSGAVRGADTIVFDGLTVTLTGGETPAQIAAKFITLASNNYVVTGVSGSVVTFQANNAGVTTDATAANFVVTDVDATTAAVAVATTTEGDVGVAEVFTANFATSGAIEDGDTIAFDGQTITLASGQTPAQIAAAVAAGTYANYNTAVSGSTVTFTAKATGAQTNVAAGDFVITNVTSATPGVGRTVAVTTQGAAAGIALPTLTIDKMVNDSTLELVAGGSGVIVKMADATGTADTFNIVTTVEAGNLDFGTVTVAGVETIKINAADSETADSLVQTGTLALNADKATAVTVAGNSNLNLSLVTDSKSVATIDASASTGKLAFAASGAAGVVAVTVTGGSAADTLRAGVGADAKADVLIGGAGADILYAGSNGAKLTGGEGNDLFIVTAASATGGNKEGNTYSEITDFKAGDLLQLQAFVGGTGTIAAGNYTGGAAADVSAIAKLAATLNEGTATFSNFVDAAIKEAGVGAAVWFNYKNDLYIVVDSADSTDTFQNGTDMIVKLTGINGDGLTWNTDFGTAALI